MIRPLSLMSEPFAPTGSMHGKGFRNLLGRPPLNPLQTVIREALQNSIDATTGDKGVSVLLRVRTLSSDQEHVLRRIVLKDLPKGYGSGEHPEQILTGRTVNVLEICDFHTVGLAGPTRADRPSPAGEPRNFINFLRDIGAGRGTGHGGGTYGYGKTSLYALSSCATIIADSLTHVGGEQVRRLMACHLGDSFKAQDRDGVLKNYTGRHWWGVEEDDQLVEPATASHAVGIADRLGLPARSGRETGTSIVILDPQLEHESGNVADTADDLIEAVLWNFWPRMVASTEPHRRLDVRLEIEGVEVPIPPPEEFPPLDLFSRALEKQRNGVDVEPIRSLRPQAHLGNFVEVRGVTGLRVGPAAREESLIPKQACHVALMRPVELIVKYLEGDAFPDASMEWAAVFTCSDDDEVEAAFAASEPPAHDDWVPGNLPKGPQRTYVNVALRELNKRARHESSPIQPAATGPGASLATTAAAMGRLLGDVSGSGPGCKTTGGTSRGSVQRTAVSMPRFSRLGLDQQGRRLAVFEAQLRNAGHDSNLRVVVEPHLVADGARTDALDLPDSYQVAVRKISLPDASLESPTDTLHVGKASGTLLIELIAPSHAAVSVRARLATAEADND